MDKEIISSAGARFVLLTRSPESLSEKIQLACTDEHKPRTLELVNEAVQFGLNAFKSENVLHKLQAVDRKTIVIQKIKRIFKSIKYLNKISPSQFRCISPIQELVYDTEIDEQKEIIETDYFNNTLDSGLQDINEVNKCNNILSSDVDPDKQHELVTILEDIKIIGQNKDDTYINSFQQKTKENFDDSLERKYIDNKTNHIHDNNISDKLIEKRLQNIFN